MSDNEDDEAPKIAKIHRMLEESLKNANGRDFKKDKSHTTINLEEDEEETSNRRRKTKHREDDAPSMLSAPKHVHHSDWKDMMHLTNFLKSPPQQGHDRTETLDSFATATPGRMTGVGRSRANTSARARNWIESRLKKRDCAQFVPSHRYARRCGCGLTEEQHSAEARRPPKPETFLTVMGAEDSATTDAERNSSGRRNHHHGIRWNIRQHTVAVPTDAYGSIHFDGVSHSRAQFARVSFDTDPRTLQHLFEKIWKLPPPKLVISIHGGLTNFDLQAKLARMFRKGILKSAKSTDAWIITNGLNAGVVKHVAAALEDLGSREGCKAKNGKTSVKVTSIGIAPWGMLKRRNRFIGADTTVKYQMTASSPTGRLVDLNDRHSHFLLADNGSIGRYGAEIVLRKQLETYLVQKHRHNGKKKAIPLVCVILEGGAFTVKVVHDYVTTNPKIPVVVCDGSGRAADLLAFTHQCIQDDGKLPESVRVQLMGLAQTVFGYDRKNAVRMVRQLIECAKQRSLLTVFRLGESLRQDVDHAILSALLKGRNLPAAEQLKLALAWNRADIAKTDIFTMGQEWSQGDLHAAMLDALVHDRVEFVQLLMENGVSMHRFLTFGRLEMLYNTDKGPHNTLRQLTGTKKRIRLPDIGHTIESLMGNAFKSSYTKDDFRSQYFVYANRHTLGVKAERARQKSETLKETNEDREDRELEAAFNASSRKGKRHSARLSIASVFSVGFGGGKKDEEYEEEPSDAEDDSLDFTFKFPFSDLMLWAVLTRRQSMAMLFWRHGEEAMAKALVATRLMEQLASQAASDYQEIEIHEALTQSETEFRKITIDLLEYCHEQDERATIELLTYELSNWGNETCLSLAALINHRPFLAHPCCQLLLSDLWHGGLQIRDSSNLKVLTGLVVPFSIFLLGFKSREQLMQQPHTRAEHTEDYLDMDSESGMSDMSDSSSSSSSDSSDDDDHKEKDHRPVARVRSDSRDKELSLNPHGLSALSSRLSNMRRSEKKGDGVARQSILRSVVIAPQLPEMEVKRARARTISVVKRKRKARRSAAGKAKNSDDENDSRLYRSRMSNRHSSLYNHHRPERDSSDEGGERNDGVLQTRKDDAIGKSRPIGWRRKLREFYSAPITTFWLWSLSFVVFLSSLVYVLLVRTLPHMRWPEYYIVAYVIVWGFEMVRKLIMIDKKPLAKKAKYFFLDFRNGTVSVAIVTFLISYILRWIPSTRAAGRVLLAANSVLWCLKLVDYMSVHPQLGPYVAMVPEMIPQMLPIIAMLFVSLLSFGLVRQSVTFQDEDWHWLLLRNLFYKPYFMLYGEVYAPEIDTCGDEAWDTHVDQGVSIGDINGTIGETCVPGYWVSPLFLTLFLLIANVLLMNTMVACCTYVFEKNVEITQEIWLFARYRQVMEYESTPFLPPPFTIIYHVYLFLKWIKVRNELFSRSSLFDASLKLFLNEEEVERLHDFEEECVEEMERESDQKKQTSNDERIHRTAERSEQILSRMSQLTTAETVLRDDVRMLETRLHQMERVHREEMDFMRQMNRKMEQLLSGSLGEDRKSSGAGGGGAGGAGGAGRRRSTERSTPALVAPAPTLTVTTPAATLRVMPTISVVDPAGEQKKLVAPEIHVQSSSGREMDIPHVSVADLYADGPTTSYHTIAPATTARRHHSEYTSITDHIAVDPALTKKAEPTPVRRPIENDPEGHMIFSEESDNGRSRAESECSQVSNAVSDAEENYYFKNM